MIKTLTGFDIREFQKNEGLNEIFGIYITSKNPIEIFEERLPNFKIENINQYIIYLSYLKFINENQIPGLLEYRDIKESFGKIESYYNEKPIVSHFIQYFQTKKEIFEKQFTEMIGNLYFDFIKSNQNTPNFVNQINILVTDYSIENILFNQIFNFQLELKVYINAAKEIAETNLKFPNENSNFIKSKNEEFSINTNILTDENGIKNTSQQSNLKIENNIIEKRIIFFSISNKSMVNKIVSEFIQHELIKPEDKTLFENILNGNKKNLLLKKVNLKLNQREIKFFLDELDDLGLIENKTKFKIASNCFTYDGGDLNNENLGNAKKPKKESIKFQILKTIIDSLPKN